MNLDVAGMVRYSPGEHVVLFLYRTPIGLIRTVGLAQGKLQNRYSLSGCIRCTRRTQCWSEPSGAKPSGASISELEALPLSTVRERVARLAGAAKQVRK